MGWRVVRRFCRRRREVRRQAVRTGNGPDRGLGGSLISQIVPAGGDPHMVVPEKVRAREGPLFSAVRGRGNPATGTPGIELRSPLLGLISAQGMSFGGGCGTDAPLFYVRGARPAPRGVRSVVSAARYRGFPGPQYLTPLSLPEHFFSGNGISPKTRERLVKNGGKAWTGRFSPLPIPRWLSTWRPAVRR